MTLQNEEYEQALLSCIMLDFKIMADLCIIMKSEYFKNENNALIFRTLCEMYQKGLVYDTKVLYDKLKKLYMNRVLNSLSASLKDKIAEDKSALDIISFIETELLKLNSVSNLCEIKILKDLIVTTIANLCKSSLAMTMMINMINQGYKVGFISLEMSEDSIVKRFITLISNITIKELNERSFDSSQTE